MINLINPINAVANLYIVSSIDRAGKSCKPASYFELIQIYYHLFLMETQLHPEKLLSFFLHHLNRLYCAKSHLAERFSEIEEASCYEDLQNVIVATKNEAEKELLRVDEIYKLLGTGHTFESCNGVIRLLDDAFAAIQQ